MTSYMPPPRRLIIRSLDDLERLNTSATALKAAADPNFWAYKDFDGVVASFALEPSNPERRVLGIEGVGSPERLQELIKSGSPCLNMGHLSLVMMEDKVRNGEWKWIDEPQCVMHTATPKPALLRASIETKLGMKLAIMRHDAKLAGDSGGGAVESEGDLIIFDMDWRDVNKSVGNTKVFCQWTANLELGPLDTLDEGMLAALDTVLSAECR